MTCVAAPLLRGCNEGTSVSVSRVFSSAVVCNVFCDNSRRRDQQLYITPRLAISVLSVVTEGFIAVSVKQQLIL